METVIQSQETQVATVPDGEICPECNEQTLQPGSGCSICQNCGYTPCK